MTAPAQQSIRQIRDAFVTALTEEDRRSGRFDPMLSWLDDLVRAEAPRAVDGAAVEARRHIAMLFREALLAHGIAGGEVLEIGGPHNSISQYLPDHRFSYLSIYPVAGRSDVIVGDAAACQHVRDRSFDAIFSVSVFEHIEKPWAAARHLTRLLREGGVMFHAAPFSYFYHGAPADYWRYTPDAMTTLFAELEPLEASFFGRNRRRDNRGSPAPPVDGDGGPAFAVDAFGGWRENWTTIFCARKSAAFAADRRARLRRQLIVNLMKCETMAGLDDMTAAARVQADLRGLDIDAYGEIAFSDGPAGDVETIETILTFWQRRSAQTVRPNSMRFAQHALVAGMRAR